MSTTVKLSYLDSDIVSNVLKEYRMLSVDVCFKQDATVDEFVDVIEGNRVYTACIYVMNKIDQITIEVSVWAGLWCPRRIVSCGCDSGRYYRVAHGTWLVPNDTQSPCRVPVACLGQTSLARLCHERLPSQAQSGAGPQSFA